MVTDIITTSNSSQQWNVEMAKQFLNDEDLELMFTLYLPQLKTGDFLIWPLL